MGLALRIAREILLMKLYSAQHRIYKKLSPYLHRQTSDLLSVSISHTYVITHVFHQVLPERVKMDKAALAGHIGDCCCHVLPRLLKAGREYWQHQHEQHAGDS